MLLEITEHTVGDVTVLKLKGRMILDEGESPLRTTVDALVQQGRLKIVLDLEEVTDIDSAGLGILVSKYVSVQRRGGNIELLHLTPRSAGRAPARRDARTRPRSASSRRARVPAHRRRRRRSGSAQTASGGTNVPAREKIAAVPPVCRRRSS